MQKSYQKRQHQCLLVCLRAKNYSGSKFRTETCRISASATRKSKQIRSAKEKFYENMSKL